MKQRVYVSLSCLFLWLAPALYGQEWTFTRGDLNGDGELAIADPLFILNYLFLQGPEFPCLDAGDVDDDGLLSLLDGISLLTYMFASGPEPPPPFGKCGVDPTRDALGCAGPLAACAPAQAAAPSNLLALAASATQIDLTWFDNSDDETAFQIDYSLTGINGPYTLHAVVGPDTTMFSDVDLTPATEYCYRIQAVNEFGASDYSNSDCTSTDDPPPPIPPSGLVASSISDTRIDLLWVDNSPDETAFRIERSVDGIGGAYVLLAQVVADTTTYSDLGLQATTEYCYRVAAVGFGTSDPSAPDCAATDDPPPPAAPSSLVATATSDSEINVTWQDNADDENSVKVERSVSGVGGPYDLIATLGPNSTSILDANLNPLTEYCYRVQAVGANGASPYSNSDCATTPEPPAPAAPSLLNATPVSATQVDVVWLDNSDDEDGFEVERSVSGAGGPYQLAATVGANSTGFSDANLTPLTEYCYRVRAFHASGASAYSNADCETTLDAPPPATPQGLAAVATGYDQIEVTWNDLSNNETGFEVERSFAGGQFQRIATSGANATLYIDHSLNSVTEYCYQVRAITEAATSDYSNSDCATTSNFPPPHDPTGLVLIDVTESQIDFAWMDNADDEAGYEILRSVDSGSYQLHASLPPNSMAYSDRGLTSGIEYCYRVQAFNAFGVSDFAKVLGSPAQKICEIPSLPPPPPASPSSLAAVDAPEGVDLTWVDNSATETGFEIERSDRGAGGPFALIDTVEIDITSYSDSGLTPLEEYCYRVHAINSGGASGESNVDCATAQPLPPPPSAPSGLVVTENGYQQVDLVWVDNAGDETGFEIERSDSGAGGPFALIATAAANATNYSDQGLFANHEYCYHVRAVNSGGASADSNDDCATTEFFSDPTLVASYGFDEGGGTLVQDLSGSGNDGDLENGATRNSNGQFSDAVEFDGIAGNVSMGNFNLTGNALTISAWCHADDFDVSDARIVSKATGLSNATTYWMIGTLDNNGVRLRFRLKTTDGGTTQLIANITIAPGAFFHVAVVYDGSQMSIYQDGVLVGSTPKTGSIVIAPAALAWIGANPVGGKVFDGLIDNVRIYERALTQDEVLLDMTTPAGEELLSDPPIDPSGLGGTSTAEGIDLTWVDNSVTESSFQIERSVDGPGGPFTFLVSVGPNVSAYSDIGLESFTTYCYRVRALNLVGASNYTNVGCATTIGDQTPGAIPQIPTAVKATAVAQTSISISWVDNANNETGYEIERSDSVGGPYTLLFTAEPNRRVYFDNSVGPNQSYFYRVRAVNTFGASAWGTDSAATDITEITQVVLVDTGIVEISENGPYFPGGWHGDVDFQTHIPLPDMDYTSPVDYSNGDLFQRIDIIERPSLVPWCANQPIQESGPNGDHGWPMSLWSTVREPYIYYTPGAISSTRPYFFVDVEDMVDNTGLLQTLDNPPPLRLAFRVECVEEGGGSSPWTDARIYPMLARFTWVLASDIQPFNGWILIVGGDRPRMDPLGTPFVTSYEGPVEVNLWTDVWLQETKGGPGWGNLGSKVRYTLDGSEPNSSSPVYNGPILINTTTTIKAKTYTPGCPVGDTTTTTYVIAGSP